MSTVLEEPRAGEAVVEAPPVEAPPEQRHREIRPVVPAELERPLTREEILRPAIGALMTTLGSAFLVGGMFVGTFTPRFHAAVGGVVGVAMAVWAAGSTGRRASLVQGLSLLGILIGGIVLLGFKDPGAIGRLGEVVGDAASNARLHRPPAAFDLGWRAILPWTVGMIGYAAAWVGAIGRKPAVGLLVPIPIIAFSAIAQPAEAQIPAGIVAFVTFVLGLAIIYRADRGEGAGISTAYELKRAARTAPLVLVLVVALVALSQTGFLFPEPLYDPTQQPQLPKAIPLKGVKDRVLYTVEQRGNCAEFPFTGPWRVGVLDVYDSKDWRLPAFAASSLEPVPTSGVLDDTVQPEACAKVTIDGLEGTVLPLPGRMHGLIVKGAPALVVDSRGQTVRVEEGQVAPSLFYDAFFALLPTEDQLKETGPPNPDIAALFLDTAGQPAPPAVAEQLATLDPELSMWERLDAMRKHLLETVTATGQGLPVSVPPSKVQDMLGGSKEATPFEIVAAQALIARWTGVPARIGYGFDRGEEVGGGREYRPKHGAAWLEVYFQGYGWLPITGLPKKAKRTLGSSDEIVEADILPSEEIAVQLFIPLRVSQKNALFIQAQKMILLASPFVVTVLLVWLLWPIAYKARRRSRRRQWALQEGRLARIAIAYTELRDMATDLGVGDPYLTPLAYTNSVVPDEEHLELGWLVTRCLWGDLKANVTDDEVFAAEELSRSLRRRLFEAQPFTIRAISLVSRLSLRNPYAPELLSPPLPKLSLRAALSILLRALPRPRLRRRKVKEEAVEEAVEAA